MDLAQTGYLVESIAFGTEVPDLVRYRIGEIEQLLTMQNAKTTYPELVVPIGHGGAGSITVCGPDESWNVGEVSTFTVTYTTPTASGQTLVTGKYRCTGREHSGEGRQQAETDYTFEKVGGADDFVSIADA